MVSGKPMSAHMKNKSGGDVYSAFTGISQIAVHINRENAVGINSVIQTRYFLCLFPNEISDGLYLLYGRPIYPPKPEISPWKKIEQMFF